MKKNYKYMKPINFDDFDIFTFYDEYKNLRRDYLFNLIASFNFITENQGNFSITFDTLTKIGLLLHNIDIEDKYENELNKFFIKLVSNSLIGYALPIFKLDNVVYTKSNCTKRMIDLENNINELESFFTENLNIIIFDLKITNNIVVIEYIKNPNGK